MEYLTVHKQLIEIKNNYSKEIKDNDPEEYAAISALTGLVEWGLRIGEKKEEIPTVIYTLIYVFLGAFAQFISFLLLVLGFVLLGISAF